MKKPSFEKFGEHGILISWEALIDSKINDAVRCFERAVLDKFTEEIIETVTTYHSVAVYVSKATFTSDFLLKLNTLYTNWDTVSIQNESHITTIPVCYDIGFGFDLDELASKHKLSVSKLIALHTKPLYKVYFTGFLPGFPYLGGLDPKLHTPRRAVPRPYIEKGAVGIGGNQTGVYTQNSPGGWNIIGKTPLDFFDITKKSPSLLRSGDYVRFRQISLKEFDNTRELVRNGIYIEEKEVHHD